MDRRQFLCGVTTAAAATAAPRVKRKLTYDVKGFTCVTCAIGLETMLRSLRGVTGARASYPRGKCGRRVRPRGRD